MSVESLPTLPKAWQLALLRGEPSGAMAGGALTVLSAEKVMGQAGLKLGRSRGRGKAKGRGACQLAVGPALGRPEADA